MGRTMSDPILTVSGLRTGYGATEILRGVDLVVHAGEVVAVLGSNGAGKSTLNRTISGVMRPWQGSIRFTDILINKVRPAEIVARGLIHVPEGRRIFPNMSVRENLDLGAYRRGGARKIANAYSASFRGSPSGRSKAPARCRAASSRCSRSAAG